MPVFRLALLCILSCLVYTARATNRTWTGGGTDNHWTTAANWQGGVAPVAGDNLIFNGVSNAGNTSNYNNFPASTVFGSISINTASAQDFSLGGNRVMLTNGISETAGGIGINALAGFVYFDITLGHDQVFTAQHSLYLKGTVDLNAHFLTLSNLGTINVTGVLTNLPYAGSYITKTNTGALNISIGANLGTDLWLKQGSLRWDGLATNSVQPVNIYGIGVAITGTGTADFLEPSLGYDLTTEGYVSPGDTPPGVITCNDLDLGGDGGFFALSGALQIVINGTNAGSQYSEVIVNDNYYLNNSSQQDIRDAGALNVQMNYTPQIGDSYRIIQDVSGEPYDISTNGNFFGLTQNGLLDLTNGYTLAVTYDQNGVLLTTFRYTNSPFLIWKGSVTTSGSFGIYDWSNTNNWCQGQGPGPGARLQFTDHQFEPPNPYGSGPLTIPPLTNDLSPGSSVASLLFTDTNYALYGNALTITEGITNQSGGTIGCHIPIVTTGPLTLEADAGSLLLLDQSFNGSGTLQKMGVGRLVYTGTTMNTYVGTVAVNSGTMQVDGSFTDGSFTVNGGLLDGTGTISVTTMNGGTLKPGDSPGILHIQGNLTMSAGSVFEAELNGPLAGTNYDQLQVNGNVNLNGATLKLVPGYSAVAGTAFLILINQGSNPIVGTFAGLPEGAVFSAGGQYFSITYKAGTGANDVVVTAVNQPPAPPSFTKINVLTNGNVQLQGTGTSNVNYTVQANTNLLSTNWQNIGTTTPNGSNAFSFSTSNAFSFPQRFFRLVAP